MLFLLFIVIIACLTGFGCGKGSGSGGKNPTPTPTLTTLDMIANGKKWNVASVTFTLANGTSVTRTDGFNSLLANGLTFTGTNADKSTGTFTNDAAGGPGTYVSEFDANNVPFAINIIPTAYQSNPIFIVDFDNVTSTTLTLEIQDENGAATVKYTDTEDGTIYLKAIFLNMEQ